MILQVNLHDVLVFLFRLVLSVLNCGGDLIIPPIISSGVNFMRLSAGFVIPLIWRMIYEMTILSFVFSTKL